MAKGGGNKSFVLRVDAATMEALEQWADDEGYGYVIGRGRNGGERVKAF